MATDFVQVAAIRDSFWEVQYTTGALRPYQANLGSAYRRKKKRVFILLIDHAIAYSSNSRTEYTRQITYGCNVDPKDLVRGWVLYKT